MIWRQCIDSPWWLLYPKIRPATHDASIVHGGETHALNDAASEVAAFGSFLAAPAADGGEVLIDAVAGLGARTRPADPTHPLAQGLGYGALSAVSVPNEHRGSVLDHDVQSP